jgi:hypothetical protein
VGVGVGLGVGLGVGVFPLPLLGLSSEVALMSTRPFEVFTVVTDVAALLTPSVMSVIAVVAATARLPRNKARWFFFARCWAREFFCM